MASPNEGFPRALDASPSTPIEDLRNSRNASEVCMLPETELRYVGVAEDPAEVLQDIFKTTAIFVLPFAGPALAFGLWRKILALTNFVLGEEKDLITLTQVTLNPTTNGIVVACLASALGLLTSVTVWSLRSRQLDLRTTINREACECQLFVTRLTVSAPLPVDEAARDMLVTYIQMLALMRQYVARVLAESSKAADVEQLEFQGASASELAGVVRAARQCQIPRSLVEDVSATVSRLTDSRSLRLATLTTSFPVIHWVILALLGASISCCYLIEVDQYEGRFLTERPEDSLRLRLIFTMLVGAFSALSALCADLNDPFRGSFNVTASTQQLSFILASIDQELEVLLLELNPLLSRGDLEREMKTEMRKINMSGGGIIDFSGVLSWLRSQANR